MFISLVNILGGLASMAGLSLSIDHLIAWLKHVSKDYEIHELSLKTSLPPIFYYKIHQVSWW